VIASRGPAWPDALRTLPVALIGSALVLPVLAVLASWLDWDAGGADVLAAMVRHVLPECLWTTIVIVLPVAIGVAAIGAATAASVALLDFPGRRVFEWALLLPMAMPAYVVAYAYTDFLQYAGPLQEWLRAATGRSGRMLPEIRSVGGAVLVFTVTLYPYVYLLVRAALSERAAQLMDAARLLGAAPARRVREVALPLARPAIAAGVVLALMETMADFGVSSYFGVQTFTAAIYKSWLALDDRVTAARLATVLLAIVAVLVAIERRAQRRLRFAGPRGAAGSSAGTDARRHRPGPRGRALAFALCAAPVVLGFVLPAAILARLLAIDASTLPWARFAEWAGNSVRLGAIAAAAAVVLALALAFVARRWPSRSSVAVRELAGLGYAVPGAVIVVGLLLPVGWAQARWPGSGVGALVTATSLGLVWAYLVRFVAVALQSVGSGYTRIPANLDESARMLGVGAAALALRVHAPLLARSAAVAALLVFVDVVKELPATMVLRPFGSDTLAVVAYQLARDERLGEAALPAMALVLVGLLPLVLASRVLRSPQDRGPEDQ